MVVDGKRDHAPRHFTADPRFGVYAQRSKLEAI